MDFLGVGVTLLFLWGLLKLYSLKAPPPRLPRSARLRLSYDMPPSRIFEMMDYLTPAVPVTPGGDFVNQNRITSHNGDPVYFKPGEPRTFDEYDGQVHIVGYLRDAIAGMGTTEESLEPQMFLGMAGMGKTLLAKVVANELGLRAQRLGLAVPHFLEVFPADLPDVAALDEVMRRICAHPGSVVFIDEIHDLLGSHTRKLYLVLEEGRYQFRGEAAPIKLPPVTLLGATTDYGALHPALKRRWIRHVMEPASPEQLVGYIMRRPFPIGSAEAWRIVDRTKFSGAPWEGLELYRMAVTTAKGRAGNAVIDADINRVFELQKLDELGLRWMDRAVIKALLGQPRYRRENKEQVFVCYAASEANVASLAGIDKAEYRESIRPRLMSRGLLEIRVTYGQALTDKASSLYGHLGGVRDFGNLSN